MRKKFFFVCSLGMIMGSNVLLKPFLKEVKSRTIPFLVVLLVFLLKDAV